MPEDASLTEFVGEEATNDAGPDDESPDSSDSDEREESKPDPAVATVEPATVTFAWTDESATCADCGATARRQWGDDGDLVCADCKEW